MSTDRDLSGFGFGRPLGTGADPRQNQQGSDVPDRDASDRFARAMAEPAPAAASPGDAMLRLLGAAPPAGPPSGDALGRLLDEMADRMLVTDPRHGGRDEVRVEVKDAVFPGLEVRVREEAGRLVVELVSARASDLALLRADAPAFAGRLGAKLGREVEIRLTRRSAEDAGETAEDVILGDRPDGA